MNWILFAFDIVGAKYLKVKNGVCFMDSAVFVYELPVSKHNLLEVVEVHNGEKGATVKLTDIEKVFNKLY